MRPPIPTIVAAGALLVGCGPTATATPPPTPTAEAAATPTLTATAPPSPTATAAPATVTSTATTPPAPSRTPAAAPAATTAAPPAEGAASGAPTAAGGGSGSPKAIAGDALPLKVTYTNIHYECHKGCMEGGGWAYRYLQVLMVVENNVPDLTIEAPWGPSRWIMTDGSREWSETNAWEWTQSGHPPPPQPNVAPGARVEWTWITAPIPSGAWVKAIEFDIGEGYTLRQDLARPGQEQNYVECGEPREGQC